jgi:hypothetical protein
MSQPALGERAVAAAQVLELNARATGMRIVAAVDAVHVGDGVREADREIGFVVE